MSQPWTDAGPSPVDPREDSPDSALGTLSPRTALLSPSDHHQSFPLPTPRSNHRFDRQRKKFHQGQSTRELITFLTDRCEEEAKRAASAEQSVHTIFARARGIQERLVTAEGSLTAVKSELQQYKTLYDQAQQQLLHAQEVVRTLESRVNDAEQSAAKARTHVRRLNEERLVELAREEGRRLGFEEGIRRGRNMGYREGHQYAQMVDAVDTVERLLEARDDVEEESDSSPPPPPLPKQPQPPRRRTSHPPPAVHRSAREPRGEPVRGRHNSDVDSSGTQRHQSAGVPASVPPTSPSTSRARRATGYVAPIFVRNGVPTVNHSETQLPPDGFIPTLDPGQRISLPHPHEFQRNITSPSPSQRTLSQPTERPELKTRDFAYEPYQPPRPSTESVASTRQSESTILDIRGLPRPRSSLELSVIPEDVSTRSERMADYSPAMAARSSAASYRRERDEDEAMRRQEHRRSKQRLADQLRYSDPAAVEEWRREGDKASTNPKYSLRPHPLTMPTPLSSTQGRSHQSNGSHRRPHSSDSSVPEINIEPPSGPPSDAPSHATVRNTGMLSPDHANIALPIPPPVGSARSPSGPALVPTVPNSPVIPNAAQLTIPGQGQSLSVLADGQSSPSVPQGLRQGWSSIYAPPSDRREGGGTSPAYPYPMSPAPFDVVYPAPPVMRQDSDAQTSRRGGKRSKGGAGSSAGAGAGAEAPVPGRTGSQGSQSRAGFRPSNVYNAPAYVTSRESLGTPGPSRRR